MDKLIRRLRYWTRRQQLEADLAEELETHRALKQDELERSGLSAAEAAYASRRLLGNALLAREDARGVWIWPWLENLAQDLRYGARMLARNPGFTAVAVLSLALGIGANTAIFSLMDALFWRPLPVSHPEQLALVRLTSDLNAEERARVGFLPVFLPLRLDDASEVFAGILTTGGVDGISLGVDGATERVNADAVSGNYFSVLGVRAFLGRNFSAEIEEGSWAAEVVLTHRFWRTRFGADPTVIDKTIRLNGYPFTVVGISPPGFFGTTVGDYYEVRVPKLPEPLAESMPAMPLLRREKWPGEMMARLRPGVSLQQAESVANAAYRKGVLERFGEDPRFRGTRVQLRPGDQGDSRLRGAFERPLTILFGLVALVLLVACANLANLLLGRATARRRETAVRLAIGASRGRLVRQWLTESMLLSFLGGTLGVLLAYWGVDALLGFLPPQGTLEAALAIKPDLRALGFTLSAATLSALLFGLAPALHGARLDPLAGLKGGGPGDRRRGIDLRQALVMAEVALALPLLIAAGLCARTLQNLHAVDSGFDADDVVLFTMKHVHERYAPHQLKSFWGELLERVESLPGVRRAGVAEIGPLGRREQRRRQIAGSERAIVAGEFRTALVDDVSPGFFESAGISLLAGRDFSLADREGAPRVAVIDDTVAHDLFGEQYPVGRSIQVGRIPNPRPPDRGKEPSDAFEIIGVVRSTKHRSLREGTERGVYLPIFQSAQPWMPTLYVRAKQNLTALIAAVRREVQGLDKDLPVFNVKTFGRQVDEALAQDRLVAGLSTLFGLLAASLAAIGLYGVIAYAVASRIRELGIRQALGARPGALVWLVLREALLLASIGLAVGLAAAIAGSRFVASVLFGLAPTDPVTFASATFLLLTVAMLAGYLPARRASRVDPILALRYE